ncbi:MAG TPA: hypothetical protein VK968_00940 [Roseimicrobium sp.]|nr:hypothetical protein [Roseimicrobium sp.]
MASAPFTAGVVCWPFLPATTYEIAVLYPTHEELSQIVQGFLATVRTHLRNQTAQIPQARVRGEIPHKRSEPWRNMPDLSQ